MAYRAQYIGWCVATVCSVVVGIGCSDSTAPDDGASSGSGGDTSSSSSSGSGGVGPGPAPSSASSGAPLPPLDTIDGIDMPTSLTLCGAIVPTVSDEDVRFDWSGAPAETTQYAVRLAVAAEGSTTFADLAVVVQPATSIGTGGNVAGSTYRLDAYALQDRTPLCTLGGVNTVTPR